MRTKTVAVLAALALLCAGCYENPAKNLAKGGFTFDFKASSDARFNAKSVPGNLADGLEQWKGSYCWMHNSKVASNDPRRKEVRKVVQWKTEGNELVVVKPKELVDVCKDEKIAASVSGGFVRLIALPDETGGTYRVSFRYRMRHDVGDFGGLLFTPRLSKAAKEAAKEAAKASKPARKAPGLQVYTLPNLWSEDGLWVKDIKVSPGCDSVEVVMRIDGVGELRFSDFSVTRVTFDTPVSVQFSPAGYVDGTFAFSAGQCGLMCMQWRRNDETKYMCGKMEYELSLPFGYTMIEAVMADTNGVSATKRADGSTTYRMKANYYAAGVPPTEFQGWNVLSALVRADANTRRGEATFSVYSAGARVSNVAKVEVFTIPRIEVKQPKRYANGFYPGGPYCAFRSQAAREAFSDMFTSAGAKWIANMSAGRDVYAMWRRKGIRYITPEWYLCANGFRVGDGKGRPDDQKYVTPAKDRPDYSYATCPIAVYEEKSYFLEKFVPQLAKYLDGADGLWANWEPYYFAGRGCFCDNCCRAFADWMKVPYEEMKKEWPDNLKWGAKYGQDILKFRSWQHGRLVKTINKHVIAATGGAKSVGFIPGIAWCEMSSAWRPSNMAAEVQAIDYAGSLRWIDPWGPYPWWAAGSPYVDRPADLLGYWCAAKDVREQVDRDYPEGSRPKLMALPHGYQGADAICQPEGISMAFDAFFFNRWQAAVAYTFPKGFDARWWRAFADATARAAKYEDAVIDGTRADAKVHLMPDVGYPPPASDVVKKYLAWTKEVSYLQCAAFDFRGGRVCAEMNFAHDAVANFTLKASDLPPGRYEVVDENGVTWPKSKYSRTFSAAELAGSGVHLAVPALRTTVFEFRPVIGH